MLKARLHSSSTAFALASGIVLAACSWSSDPANAQSAGAAPDVRAQADERAAGIVA